MQKNIEKSNVSFRFFNIVVDNVPFCEKQLNLKVHMRYKTFETEMVRPYDFKLTWANLIEFVVLISRDQSGHATPIVMDFTLFMSDLKGTGRNEIAFAKFDICDVLRKGLRKINIRLQSTILESNLFMDVETNGGEMFYEVPEEAENHPIDNIPNIEIRRRIGWLRYQYNTDAIDLDAEELANASIIANKKERKASSVSN
ncbi:hypothetical protein TVAG_015850 [Trichomonas vaginalis G3]|uniref:Uncharacterized protein n=1 Tax=Trichomonas vaginalis (strain ATCC PRA-98 / G3) TaxID=412133 RepID=A2DP56_TRIV3|nr:hypothetical protein TVAG_015850 [Trichomonas vaginalis G3]|eukprot:XP_001329891.1 hypothetical protein [Trichomonas vaginalis G3]